MWDAFEATFRKHGQDPDRYVCNCGPYSAPASAGAGTIVHPQRADNAPRHPRLRIVRRAG